jgi:hypothetical protein
VPRTCMSRLRSARARRLACSKVRRKFPSRESLMVDALGSGSVDVRNSDPVAVALGPIYFIHVVVETFWARH